MSSRLQNSVLFRVLSLVLAEGGNVGCILQVLTMRDRTIRVNGVVFAITVLLSLLYYSCGAGWD